MAFDNYRAMLTNKYIHSGYLNTIIVTVVTTVLSLILTSMGAYCMASRNFPNRKFWMGILLFTMYFSGGLIPTYLTYIGYGLKDSLWALILPSLCSAYNLIIMRNFFMQLPESIIESGRVDGAGEFQILFNLVLPISKPVLATIGMWVAVGRWNSWFDCLVYIRDPNKSVLQVILRRIILQGSNDLMAASNASVDIRANPEGLKAAAIFVTTIPILLVYPFLQKYFVKGIVLGSVKG